MYIGYSVLSPAAWKIHFAVVLSNCRNLYFLFLILSSWPNICHIYVLGQWVNLYKHCKFTGYKQESTYFAYEHRWSRWTNGWPCPWLGGTSWLIALLLLYLAWPSASTVNYLITSVQVPLRLPMGVLYTFSSAKSFIFPSLRRITTFPYLKPFPYMGIQSSAN
jgi:hypothetical protein